MQPPAYICGPTVLTARWKTCSTCRTRWHQASPAALPAVLAAEIARSADRPTTYLTAYELYLRALPNCHSWDRERIHSALELLERAIERDPSFGPALALAALCHDHFDRLGGAQDSDL